MPEKAQNYSEPFSQVWTCKEKWLANRIRAVPLCISLALSVKKCDKDAVRPADSVSSFSAGLYTCMQASHAIEDTRDYLLKGLPELCCWQD